MQLANVFFGQQFQNAGVILNGGVGHGEGTGAGGGNAAQLNSFLQHGEEGAADGVEIHQTVNLLLTQGDAFQIVFVEGAHPRGGDLRHQVAQSCDAAVAAGHHVAGEVVIKAGVNLKGGHAALDNLDQYWFKRNSRSNTSR